LETTTTVDEPTTFCDSSDFSTTFYLDWSTGEEPAWLLFRERDGGQSYYSEYKLLNSDQSQPPDAMDLLFQTNDWLHWDNAMQKWTSASIKIEPCPVPSGGLYPDECFASMQHSISRRIQEDHSSGPNVPLILWLASLGVILMVGGGCLLYDCYIKKRHATGGRAAGGSMIVSRSSTAPTSTRRNCAPISHHRATTSITNSTPRTAYPPPRPMTATNNDPYYSTFSTILMSSMPTGDGGAAPVHCGGGSASHSGGGCCGDGGGGC
jgi:hypothetical protein